LEKRARWPAPWGDMGDDPKKHLAPFDYPSGGP
jgi:hypothetical protein